MRIRRPYIVLSFHATVDAMAWENYCIGAGVPGRLIPLPKELSAGCGLAWRMLPEDWTVWEPKLNEITTLRYDAVATVQQ